MKKSIIPEWLIKKGVVEEYEMMYTLDDYKKRLKQELEEMEELERAYSVAKKKLPNKEFKLVKKYLESKIRTLKHRTQYAKQTIKEFKISYFLAEDVEKAFRERK